MRYQTLQSNQNLLSKRNHVRYVMSLHSKKDETGNSYSNTSNGSITIWQIFVIPRNLEPNTDIHLTGV